MTEQEPEQKKYYQKPKAREDADGTLHVPIHVEKHTETHTLPAVQEGDVPVDYAETYWTADWIETTLGEFAGAFSEAMDALQKKSEDTEQAFKILTKED